MAGLKDRIDTCKSEIDELISYANETTEASDATIGDAIESLVSGYGQGGDDNIKKVEFEGMGCAPQTINGVESKPRCLFIYGDTTQLSLISEIALIWTDYGSGLYCGRCGCKSPDHWSVGGTDVVYDSDAKTLTWKKNSVYLQSGIKYTLYYVSL